MGRLFISYFVLTLQAWERNKQQMAGSPIDINKVTTQVKLKVNPNHRTVTACGALLSRLLHKKMWSRAAIYNVNRESGLVSGIAGGKHYGEKVQEKKESKKKMLREIQEKRKVLQ